MQPDFQLGSPTGGEHQQEIDGKEEEAVGVFSRLSGGLRLALGCF